MIPFSNFLIFFATGEKDQKLNELSCSQVKSYLMTRLMGRYILKPKTYSSLMVDFFRWASKFFL